MNKKLLVMIAVIMAIVCVLSFTACKEEEVPQDTTFTVTFDLNYEGAPEASLVTVVKDTAVPVQTAPTRNGYNFGGWYTDKACTAEFTFDAVGSTAPIVADITLYAKWTANAIIDPTPILSTIVAFYNGENVFVGEDLDVADIVVTATYTDTSKKTVTDFTISGFDSETAGVKTVTVTYTEKGATRTATVNVTVVEKVVLASINAVYDGGDIIVGKTLNVADIAVIATYSDETKKAITDFSISGFDSTTVGEKTVTVSYTEGGITKTDDVIITVKECEHTGGTATCKTLAVCTECGESYGELDLDNHESTAEWTITETTHAQSYTCCSLVVVAEGNHEGGTATCTSKKECTVCGGKYGELDKDNHEGTAEWTITETTHAQSYTCCDAVVVAEENHEYDNACDADCNECGAIRTPADHTGGTATCTSKAVCDLCGEEYGEVNAEAHNWNAGVVTTPATCSATGTMTYTCTHNAEHTKTEDIAIDADAHAWNEGVVTTDPTCTTVGTMTYTCTHNAEHTKTEDIAINAEAHNWNAGVVTTPATCTTVGTMTYTCTHNAEHTYTEEIAINAGNHTGELEWTKTATTHAQGYTCCGAVVVVEANHVWEDGVCSVEGCGYVCEHTYEDGACTVCGKAEPAPEVIGIQASLIEDDTVYFVDTEVNDTVDSVLATCFAIEEVYNNGNHVEIAEEAYDDVVITIKSGDEAVAGACVYTLSYNGFTCDVEVTLVRKLAMIGIVTDSGFVSYNSDLVVIAMFYGMGDDYEEDVSASDKLTITGYNKTDVENTQSVTATYTENGITETDTVEIMVLNENNGIYAIYEGTLDHNASIEDIIVEDTILAEYVLDNGDHGAAIDSADITVTAVNASTVGDNGSITIQVGEFTYEITGITVVRTFVDYTVAYNGGELETGVAIDLADVSVTANYSDESTEDVEEGIITLGEYDYNTDGVKTVEVKLNGETVGTIKVTYVSYNTIYYYNENGWDSVYAHSWGVTETPIAPKAGDYVVTGTFNDWKVDGSVVLYNYSTENGGQYYFEGLNMTEDTEFKICKVVNNSGTLGLDGWYNNITGDTALYTKSDNIKVKSTGIYNIYFKPNQSNSIWMAKGNVEKEPNVKVENVFDGTTWPGEAMTAIGNGWYSIKVDEQANRIIFNNNDGEQTADLTIDLAKPYYNKGVWESHIHTYSADCDTTCNYEGCEVTRTTSESHSYPNDCTATTCTVCNEVTKVAGEHTGGEATCKTLAVCSECGLSYGEFNANNHEGIAEWTYDDETHTQTYSCCGHVVVDGEEHNYVDGECVCGKEEPETITTVGIQATLKNDRVYFVDTKDNDTVDAISASDLVISEVLSDESTVLIPQSAYENVTITILSGDENVAGACTYVVGYEDFTYNVEVTLVRKLKAVSDDNVFEYDGNVAYGSTTINILRVLVTYYGVEGQFDVTDQVVIGDFDPTNVMGEQLVDVTYTENGITAPWEISIMVIDNKGLTVTQKENVDALVLNHEQTSVDVSEILAIYDVKFVYESGKEEVVTTDITITVSAVECGNNGSITITVDGQSVTIEGLTVVRVLKEIIVNYTGDVEIDLNKEINTDYITVTAIYSNNDEEAITDYELSEYDYTTVGTKTISVLVDGDKVGEFTVNYVSYTTYYFNNVDGWEEVYAHSWGVTETPIAPKAGDYAIVGTFNGWEDSVANGSAVVLCYSKKDDYDNTEYYFEGLALPANAELKIVKVGSNDTIAEWKEVNLDSTLATGGGSSNVKISGEGNYVFYYTPATGKLYVGATDSGAKEPNVKLTTVFDGTTWPGVQMTAVEGQDGWYSIKVDARVNRIVFNNGLEDAALKKTVDLTVDASKPYYNDGVWEDHIHIYSAVCDDTCDYEGCEVTRTAEAHKYDNACDASCNNEGCEHTRVVGDHVYDNESDVDCNECGAIREIETCAHEYDNACDAECNLCGEVREVEGHKYDNACDADCNVCGEERTPADHVYDNACDAFCNVCDEGRDVPDHVFDSNCDRFCNVCNEERVAEDHVSSGACDLVCDACGADLVATADHTYANACDADCNVCGATRTPADHTDFSYNVNAEDTTKHDKVCGVCGVVLETVAHVYEQTDYLAPTCTDKGTTEYTCSDYCGHVKNVDIDATGHSETDLSYTYGDATGHFVICNVCEEEIAVENHAEFSYVVNAGDETKHDKVCGLCNGVVETVDHEYVDGTCECGATESTEPEEPSTTTVTKTIAELADDNSWVSGTKYSSFGLDGNITVSSSTDGNTGKYYSNGNDYRLYQSDEGTITIAAKEGYTIVSVKITYTVGNTGVLTLNSTNVASDEVVTVNASSITFGVGNTGSATNGQVKVTAIEVIYQAEGEVCEHEYDNCEDTECNNCGATREALAHVYDNCEDTECNNCGATRVALAHAYDNDCDAECNNCGATRTPADHVYDNACDADCNECGATRTPADHNYVDGTCSVCGKEEPTEPEDPEDPVVPSTPITASKTMTELITEYSWTDSTTKQTFNLDENVTVKVDGGNNSGKAYNGDHIRIYATDSPAGSLTITLAEGYELVSVNVTTKTGTYAYLCVGEDTTTDISNVSTTVSGNSVVLNSVKNGTNGKQVQITAMEVVYKATGGGEVECEHVYDNACDADCNECGAERTPAEHVYDNDCDANCNVCNAGREVGAHVYDNACDADCNECGAERTPADHVYDNACDAECNVCEAEREVAGHVYEDCDDITCNVCNATREPVEHNYVDGECTACGKAEPEVHEHVYDNACDTTCNTCGETREVGDHVSSGACDTACNVCGATLEATADHTVDNVCADTECNICGATVAPTGEHSYDNACDTDCNKCGATREVGDHVYTNACDTTCNNCGDVREVGDHVYDNTCDVDCNVCGAEREIEHTYDGDCDEVCNVCDATRETNADHNYVEGECSVCGATEVVTLASIEASVKDGVIFVGTAITANNFDVTKVMSNDSKVDLPEAEYANVTVALKNNEDDTSVAGTYVYVVTYQEKSVEVEVTLERKLKEIQVAYEENVAYGGEIEMLVYATFYGEEGQVDVTELVVIDENFDNTDLDDVQILTIGYTENGITLEEEIMIQVVDYITGIGATAKEGEELVLSHGQTEITGAEVIACYDVAYVYASGATQALGEDDIMVEEVVANLANGADSGVVTITDLEYTYSIEGLTVVDVLVSISATYGGGEVDVNAPLDESKVTVKATYSYAGETAVSEGYELSGFSSTTEGVKTVTVTYQGMTATFTVTVNDVETIYFYNYAKWATVYAYAWHKEGTTDVINAGWPGVAMTKEGSTQWYYVTIDTDHTTIIFGNNTYQTDDITIDYSKPYYAILGWSATKSVDGIAVLDLTVDTYWQSATARYAVYAYNSTNNGWANMTAIAKAGTAYKYYAARIADTGVTSPTNYIVCRMNPSTTANNWDNRWNQSGDLDISKLYFTNNENYWDTCTNARAL